MPPAPKPRKSRPKKRNRLVRASVLKRSPPKHKSGKPKRFAKRRCPELLDWIRGQQCAVWGFLQPFGCEGRSYRFPTEPAHVIPKARGSDDRDNVIPLCPKHHDEQEGKTAAFEAKYGVNLKELAVAYTRQFDKQVALGLARMTDLREALARLLHNASQQVEHTPECENRGAKFGVEVYDGLAANLPRWIDTEPVCTCDYAQRVRERQAEKLLPLWEAASNLVMWDFSALEHSDLAYRGIAADAIAVRAALAAGQAHLQEK